MRPKSNQCHCQALEKVSLGRAMLLVRYNWILRGVSFILFALGSPVLPKIDFFLLNFLFCKISWKFQFSVKWLHPKAKFKKGDPLKIQFYLTDTISQPNDTFSRAWQWHWFDFGLIFTFLLANWWFAARFSSCSSSLNFEAKINFYTTKENCRKCRAKCTGLKLDLGPFSGSQKRLLFNRISWWPCMIDSTKVIPLPLINGLKVILVNSSLITIRFKFLAHLFAIKGGFYLYHSIIWALNFWLR